MFQRKPVDGQNHFGLERFASRITRISHGFLDSLLGRHADLFQELSHRHVEIFIHVLASLVLTQRLDATAPVLLRFSQCPDTFDEQDAKLKTVVLLILALWPTSLSAQSTELRLFMAEDISATGFTQYLLPRFSLKHSIRVIKTPLDNQADVIIGDKGLPVFSGLGQDWHLLRNNTTQAVKFEDWLLSEIGKRAIAAFVVDGAAVFNPNLATELPIQAVIFKGDAAQGERLSLLHCGRCHVINASNRMKGMGATPSFGVLRTLDDWQSRFSTFYVLNPHPSFTQIVDVTTAFDPAHPSPIHPLTLTQGGLDAILAYVSTIEPADLGAPLQSQ